MHTYDNNFYFFCPEYWINSKHFYPHQSFWCSDVMTVIRVWTKYLRVTLLHSLWKLTDVMWLCVSLIPEDVQTQTQDRGVEVNVIIKADHPGNNKIPASQFPATEMATSGENHAWSSTAVSTVVRREQPCWESAWLLARPASQAMVLARICLLSGRWHEGRGDGSERGTDCGVQGGGTRREASPRPPGTKLIPALEEEFLSCL